MLIKNKKIVSLFCANAFTLVELIVVIAVLAVLATIAFSTVQNVSSSARDSARLTDVSSMKTSLETYGATKGALPIPDNAIVITWSGSLAWSQGTFGDNTARQLGNISKPKDPLYSNEYTYSLANNKREYELATVLEKATSFAPLNSAHAAGESFDPTIKGTYNGVAIRVASGSNANWILSVPTIIAGDVKDANLLNVILSFPKSGNIPASYVGKVTSSQPVVSFSASQVWSGSELPKTDSEYIALTTNLQKAYSGSALTKTNNTIVSLFATMDFAGYGKNLVGNMGASTSQNTSQQNITCKTLRDAGATTDGMYTIKVNGVSLSAYCDMTTDGGGWTAVARAVDETYTMPPPPVGNGSNTWATWAAHTWASNNSYYLSLNTFDALTDGSTTVMEMSKNNANTVLAQLKYANVDYNAQTNTSTLGTCTNVVGTPCSSSYSWKNFAPNFDGYGRSTTCNTTFPNFIWNYNNFALCASDSGLFTFNNTSTPRPQLLGSYQQVAYVNMILVR